MFHKNKGWGWDILCRAAKHDWLVANAHIFQWGLALMWEDPPDPSCYLGLHFPHPTTGKEAQNTCEIQAEAGIINGLELAITAN